MKIVLFGIGSGFKDVLSILPEGLDVVCLSDNDTKKQGTDYLQYRIVAPEELKNIEFDYIIITSRFVSEIKSRLVSLGIKQDKVLGLYNNYNADLLAEVNHDARVLNDQLGFSIPRIGLASMHLWPQAAKNNHLFQDDFVRYMAINLLAENLKQKGAAGHMAELGVYKGDLTVFLNSVLPEKKLYLFDTFQGFDPKDIQVENKNAFSVAVPADFSDTSVAAVMARMPNPQKVFVYKGYFPESALGVSDDFCLVSIDVDLYAPTISGLNFFYPQLLKGGYIFVHDYNNVRYRGVQKAVNEFLEREEANYFLLPDAAGSIVIMK